MDTFFPDQKSWSHTEVAQIMVSKNSLAAMTLAHAMQLARRMRPSRVLEGTVLFREGERDFTVMVFILEGQAVVEKTAKGHGETVVLDIVGPGDVLGEMSAVDNFPRSATVTATSQMVLAKLHREDFAKLIAEDPHLGCCILSSLLHRVSLRLREANHKFHMLSQVNRGWEDEFKPMSPAFEPTRAPPGPV